MSDHHQEPKDLYYHDLFQYDDHGQLNVGMLSNMNNPKVSGSSLPAYNNLLQGFDGPSYMNTSFTEYNSLATAFGLSSSTSDHEVFSSIDHEGSSHQKPVDNLGYLGGGGNGSSDGEILVTPNSSVSSSSAEAGIEEDSGNKGKKDRQKPKGSLEDGADLHSPKKP